MFLGEFCVWIKVLSTDFNIELTPKQYKQQQQHNCAIDANKTHNFYFDHALYLQVTRLVSTMNNPDQTVTTTSPSSMKTSLTVSKLSSVLL